MTNNCLDQRYGVYGLLGSVWAEKLSGESLKRARALTGLAKRVSFGDKLVEGMRNLSGRTHALISGEVISFDPRDVAELGPDRQQRISQVLSISNVRVSYIRRPGPDGYNFPQTGHTNWLEENPDLAGTLLLTTETDCEYALMPLTDAPVTVTPTQADWITRYLIPIPFGLLPLRIKNSQGEDFYNGLDFEVGEGVLVIRRPIKEVFSDNRILVESAFRRQNHLFNYTLAVSDVEGSIAPISRLVRDEQSAPAFLQALACACNFTLAPWDSTVVSREETCGRYVYQFTDGVLEVRYPHVLLSPGDTVTKGQVIGDVLNILAPTYTGDMDWWRAISWNTGLSLDGLCPFSGLVIPDTPCRATAVSQDAGTGLPGDGIHVQIALGSSDAATEAKFWAAQRRSETATGQYLNAVAELGLANVGDYTFVNPLVLYFKYLLSARSWIVTRKMFEYWDNDRVDRFQHFIKKEAPFGGLIIVRDL